MTDQTARLLRDAENYLSALHGSVARHDNLAANLGCAGCELRDRIAAERAATPAVQAPATDRAALREIAAQAIRDAACSGADCPLAEDECAEQRIQPAAWERGVLSEVYGRPEQFADAVLAVLPAPTDRAAVLDRIREVVRRLAAHAVGFQDVLDESDRGPWGKTVAADIAELRRMLDADALLSPFYEHPDCGFRWHGRDGMDVPVRDGQPVCPRCELAKAEKKLAALQRRRDEVGAECKRRGKRVLEQSEQILALERQLDEVRKQLGAEILRTGQAEAELRRMADEAQPAAGASSAPAVKPCPPGCIACATDESHDPQPAAGAQQDGARS
ncbi:hypothetical protein [Streptomyces sp. NPDC008137]|uniref:hypothetical protein n=1 Tax=Streptomyces sp. NPDC008137 TaxID=3364813 RepID=UPI0036E0989A